MGLDRMYSKSLEQRARENNRAIDNQWIRENESRELYSNSSTIRTNDEKLSSPFELDSDLKDMLKRGDLDSLDSERDKYRSDTNKEEVRRRNEELTNAIFEMLSSYQDEFNRISDDSIEENTKHR